MMRDFNENYASGGTGPTLSNIFQTDQGFNIITIDSTTEKISKHLFPGGKINQTMPQASTSKKIVLSGRRRARNRQGETGVPVVNESAHFQYGSNSSALKHYKSRSLSHDRTVNVLAPTGDRVVVRLNHTQEVTDSSRFDDVNYLGGGGASLPHIRYIQASSPGSDSNLGRRTKNITVVEPADST